MTPLPMVSTRMVDDEYMQYPAATRFAPGYTYNKDTNTERDTTSNILFGWMLVVPPASISIS